MFLQKQSKKTVTTQKLPSATKKQQRNKITVTAKIIYNNLYIFLIITRKREGKKICYKLKHPLY